MERLIAATALAVVVTAACYLAALGACALIRPEIARRFLGGLATTRRVHFLELGLRVAVGAALILSAPRMAFGMIVIVFGSVLVATSIGLALVPWRLHQRFASWAVPRATRYLPLIGISSLVGAMGLFAAVILPHVTT